MQFQHTRTILRKENMGQSMFKKYSKLQHFHEISFCAKTKFRNINTKINRQYQNTILKKKNTGQHRFKKL